MTRNPDALSMVRRAGVPIGRPVVVLVGGADGLSPTESDACEVLFSRALVPALEEVEAVLIDGGTDSGIMRLAGRARHRLRARSPQVGVVAEGTVRRRPPPFPNEPGASRAGPVDLEPHHSHVVVVPGARWGDESPWICAVAAVVSGIHPSVTVLANGGDIAYDDVRRSLADGRRVLVLGGTGRAAAHLADAVAHRPADARAVTLARSPLLTVLDEDPKAVRSALVDALDERRPSKAGMPPRRWQPAPTRPPPRS